MVIITGASGFIGNAIFKHLLSKNIDVTGIARKIPNNNKENFFQISENHISYDWTNVFTGVKCIIHCSGISELKDKSPESLKSLNELNVNLVENIIEHAAKCHVKRFIFISSIKVNGEFTSSNCSFNENHKENPLNAYARSKFDAEKILKDYSIKYKVEIVILRLPMVYGKFMNGNLNKLIKIVKTGVPLPFKLVNNSRSILSINNLNTAIERLLDAKIDGYEIFLLADDKPISTLYLLQKIGQITNTNLRIFKAPIGAIIFFSKLFGKEQQINSLISSLLVDNSKIKRKLDWTPNYSIDDSLKEIVDEII